MSTRVFVGRWKLANVLVSLAAMIATGRGVLLAQCTSHWDPFPRGEFDGAIAAACVEDGANPGRIYVAGGFTIAASVVANHVASWDGSSWSPLAAGTNGSISALAWFDDDAGGPHASALYAGGWFTTAGGVVASRIAKWNGSSWSALGSGINGNVFALTVFDDDGNGPNPPALYAGGDFTMAGGVSADRIAKWDGSSWSAVGSTSGAGYPVEALTVFDDDAAGPRLPALYAGGAFLSLAGVAANHVARWDGVAWSAVGTGMNEDVIALAVHDEDGAGPLAPALFAGGFFDMAGSASAIGIAKWDGSTWSALGSGMSGWVGSLTEFGGALIAGGSFNSAGGIGASRIARWDGSNWSPLAAGIGGTNAAVSALTVWDDDGGGPHPTSLFALGAFATAGGLPANCAARWDGTSWSPLPTEIDGIDVGNGQSQGVFAMTVYDDPSPSIPPALYAGGIFQTAGNVSASNIARWDGSAWSPLGSGTSYSVNALTVYDDDDAGPHEPEVYAGGSFLVAGGLTVNCMAKWDGAAWSSLAGGMGGGSLGVFALTVFDDDAGGPHAPQLVAGGRFNTAGGTSVNNIAAWNGTSWTALGTGIEGTYATVNALTVWDDDGNGPHPPALYAGGNFSTAGGTGANQVAKWDGTSWSPLGSGMNTSVGGLVAFDDDGSGPHPAALYAAGAFFLAGGVRAHYVAKWDGSSWSALPSELNHTVHVLTVFDEDGVGPNPPALYAGGEFWEADGLAAVHIAKWDGVSWSPLGGGVNHFVWALTPFDGDGSGPNFPALFAGGQFNIADGRPSTGVAAWLACGDSVAPTCAGDGVSGVCPCGNNGLLRHGCENSAGTGGALLTWTGNPGLTSDTFVLTSSGELASPLSIFLQGDVAIAPTYFGDGLRCVGGHLKRLYTKNAAGGVVSAPSAGEPSCSARSAARGDALFAGSARFYQVYYRDPNPGFCTNPPGNTWNVSSGLAVVWNP